MKPSQIGDLLSVTASTIRNWTRDYSAFFSPNAVPLGGRQREYTERDTAILYYISKAKMAGVTLEELTLALTAFQENDWATLPPITQPSVTARVAMVPSAAADASLDIERRSLTREITFLQERIAKMEQQAQQERELVLDLTRRLATAEAELRMWQDGRLERK